MLGFYHTYKLESHRKVFGKWMHNFRILWVVDSDGVANNNNTRLQNFMELAQLITKGEAPGLFLFTTYSALKHSNPLIHEWFNIEGKPLSIIRPKSTTSDQ